MTDLLPKSLVEAEQLADSDKKKKRKQKVQIRDIALWMQSFNTYTAVMSKRHPERVADLLAYSSQIVEASRQFKGIPWLAYDTKFRLQAAAQKRPGLADIDTTLWTLAFASAEPRERCQHCLQVDHPSSECEEKPEPKEDEPPPKKAKLDSKTDGTQTNPICKKWNRGDCFSTRCDFRHQCLECHDKHPRYKCPLNRNFSRPSPQSRSNRDRKWGRTT